MEKKGYGTLHPGEIVLLLALETRALPVRTVRLDDLLLRHPRHVLQGVDVLKSLQIARKGEEEST